MTNEDIFNANIKIAYKIANAYKINYPNEFEDIKQIALIGLWKAICTYNQKYKLSTYAYKVISNEINLYLRNAKKHFNLISLNTLIIGSDDNSIELQDILPSKESIDEDIINKIETDNLHLAIQNIYNNLTDRDKEVYKLLLQGKTQNDIAKIFKISQACVCRIQQRINIKIKNEYLKGGKLYGI